MTYVIAEIGLNHNGSITTAFELIDVAKWAGCDCVKFQKRTIEKVYSAETLAKPREGPFGTTYGDEKHALEFGEHQYNAIDAHCKEVGIDWSASCWDEESVYFIESFGVPFLKIPSPVVTQLQLLKVYRDTGLPLFLSTGLCDMDDVQRAMDIVGDNVKCLMHCISGYPAPTAELNLSVIPNLAEFFKVPVGYSGHEVGIPTTVAAVAWGAVAVERHITLDRTMYGSDHAASIEPVGLERLVRYIRAVDAAKGDGVKRIMPCEDISKRANLGG